VRGTGYAIAEIIWWLLIAALIGFVIGWVLRKWFLDRQGSDALAEFEAAEAEKRQALQSELDDLKSKASSLSTDLDQRTADLDRMKTQLSEREQKIASFDAQTSEHRSAVAKLEQKIEDREATIAALRADKGKEDGQIAQLRSDLDAANSTIGTLRTDLDSAQRKQAGTEAELADCTAKLAAAESAAPALPPEMDELPDKDVAVAKVAEIATRTRGTGPTVDDDLKLIHGVGPKLERLLKSMDITSFRQVANFTTDDIQYVTAALDAFPGRIERDDWMSSAAAEHQKKYGEPA
jgi:predicted flap endonuclease-1-like 5' DNA nuclease